MTIRLGDMSWTELRDAIATRPVVLLPIGVVEQHGPHLPLNGDSLVADWVANRVAEQTSSLVAPVLNYGNSPFFRGYPGTINLRLDTLRAVTYDILTELARHGLRRIVVVNNNGGNVGAVSAAAYEARRDCGIIVGHVYPWALGYTLMRDQYDDVERAYGHGAEPEHSAMLAMFPELVKSDKAESGPLHGFDGWTPRSYSEAAVPGQSISGTVFWDYSEISESGARGDVHAASAELGNTWVERVVGFAVDFVKEYDRNTRDAAWASPPEPASRLWECRS